MPMTIEVEESFAAPPGKVWAVLADPDSMAKWMKGLVRIERLGGPPFAKGTRFREVRTMFGREASEVFEVLDVDPPRSFTLYVDGKQGSSGRGEFRFRHELRPSAGGTTLRITGEIGGMGWFMSLLGKLFCGSFRKAMKKDLASLKAVVEGGSPATS